MIVHVLKRENVRDQVFEGRRKGGNTNGTALYPAWGYVKFGSLLF